MGDTRELMIQERDRLVFALGDFPGDYGFSLACVAGIDAAEAIRRMQATVVELDDETIQACYEDPWGGDAEQTVGVTDVPGGCVVVQPWSYHASALVLLNLLSAGTVGYGMNANPKSGNQGSVHRDGATIGWDLHPGGGADRNDSSPDALLAEVYDGHAVPFCCAYTGLRIKNNRAFTEPDTWVRLPSRDYWHA